MCIRQGNSEWEDPRNLVVGRSVDGRQLVNMNTRSTICYLYNKPIHLPTSMFVIMNFFLQ